MFTVLEKSARAAGIEVLSYFHKESHMHHKTSHRDLVTAADIASQTLIQTIVVDELGKLGVLESEIGFIGEEHLEKKGTKHSFIIDPLDGTNNFASGLDYFCISIAHAIDGIPMESMIYWPSKDIVYYAVAGKGAYKIIKKGKPMRLSIQDELLENSVVFICLSSRQEYRKKTYLFLEKVSGTLRGTRMMGSACLDLVHLCDTENATHLTVNFHGYLWDVAAGYLIVKESGGVFTNDEGDEIVVDYSDSTKQYSYMAAHPNVIKELKKYL